MTYRPFGEDFDPVAFEMLAAIVDTLCGLLIPTQLAIGLELKRVLQEAAQARTAGIHVTSASIGRSQELAATILLAALNAEMAQFVPQVTDPRRGLD
jgi:hypothetical protein